jgi:surface polysaccharide O-acyltransferase-like enzyme
VTPGRELSADLYRVVAVLVVVAGHWLISSVFYRDGQFGNEYPLDVMPWTQWLTLVFQVVPVFFLVGGYASATSWMRYGDGGGGPWIDWVRHRLGAILGPTTAYAVLAFLVIAALDRVGVERSALSFGGWAVAMHLWFIPVYLVVVALTPAAMAAHRRWRLLVPTALVLAVVAVDVVARLTREPAIGVANYVLCWGAVYQIGICWRGGALRGTRALLLAAGGSAVVVILLALRWYPISMVGAPGAKEQNNFPPNVALLAFSVAQAGILVAVAPAVTRLLRRSRLQRPLAAANANVMALYLWQMVPVVVVALVAYPAGLLPQPAPGTGEWWLLRLAWLAILSAVTAAELALLWATRSVFDRALPSISVPLPRWNASLLLCAGIASSTVALARVSVAGFAPNGRVPVTEGLLYGAGVVLLSLKSVGVQRRSRGHGQAPSR